MKELFVYAVPVFLSFIAWELWASRRRKDVRGYFAPDALASIAMGFGNLGLGVLTGALHVALYSIAYRFRVFDLPRTVATYATLVVVEDFAYYWFHRVSHECRLFWVAHETHHSSAYYNLSTAVRQTWTGWVHTWVFWVWIPVLGFPVEWVLLQQVVSLVYQFFIHTELVGRLGPFEWVMNTPSHHRVHHGTDVPYLDKNYGGIFIVWDRLFGTFETETIRPTYGVLKPPESHNPFVIGFHAWKDLAADVVSARTWRGRWNYVFGRPGYREDGTGLTVPQMQARYRAAAAE